MDTRHRSPARILAPLALIVFALALLVILSSGGGGGRSTPSSSSTRAEQRDLELKRRAARTARSTRLAQTVYVVRTGDTLAAIAQKTGVPIEKLQTLNPNLDPQGLLSGQRIKLR
jgi:LysM repeat protein